MYTTLPEFAETSGFAYPLLNFIPKSYSVLLIVLEDEFGTAGKFTSGCPAAPEVAPLTTLEPSNSFCVPVTSGKIPSTEF